MTPMSPPQAAPVEPLKTEATLVSARLDFLRGVVHELRTPLTPMRVQLYLVRELVRNLPADAQIHRSLDILERSMTRLGRLVDETLDVSRIQEGHFKVQPQRTSVSSIMGRAFQLFQPQAQEAGIKLIPDYEGGLEADVDADRLAQVVENLLGNALRHTPRGGTVVLMGFAEERRIVLGVHDTGQGVAADDVAGLFDPYAMSDSTCSTRRRTGLGLYISKGIIEAHGGTIWCESQGPGRGTTVLASLPKPVPPRRVES